MDSKALKRLESDLWESADLLRADSKLTSNQYCMPVLGLIFLRYAYFRFKLVETDILKNRPTRNGKVMPVEASDFMEKSAIFLPRKAQYEYLVNLPENISEAHIEDKDGHEMTSLGQVVNNAMALVEDQSDQLKGVLPKSYTDFSDELLAELLRIFNNNALDDVGGDVIGRIYEYFLNKFAKNIASDDGVFFTPKSLVKMIVNVLEPKTGVLLDPACGSGGMFVQTGDFVNQAGMNANSTMTFYGQEKVEYNAQLCLMNMAVHGLTGVIKSGDEANTFYHDAHNLAGKCDYVMANPPFNVDKVKASTAKAADRLPFGTPGVNKAEEFSNANYLWISYFYAYLNENGRAGFVMASSATDAQKKEKDIRQKIVETGNVDVIISVGNNFFYTKSLPCTLWFFDKGKKENVKGKTLFIDARNYYTVVDRTNNEWTDCQIKNLTAIVWLYRGEVDKYKALLNEYKDEIKKYIDKAAENDAVKNTLTDDIESTVANIKNYINDQRKQAKEETESAARKDKKSIQKKWDEKLSWDTELLTIAEDALWLYEKFGTGEYKDIAGLCKIATVNDIQEKGWSLTPGAYVGVAPIEDDGVDFETRMKEIHKELLTLQSEANNLMNTISKNLEEMGL